MKQGPSLGRTQPNFPFLSYTRLWLPKIYQTFSEGNFLEYPAPYNQPKNTNQHRFPCTLRWHATYQRVTEASNLASQILNLNFYLLHVLLRRQIPLSSTITRIKEIEKLIFCVLRQSQVITVNFTRQILIQIQFAHRKSRKLVENIVFNIQQNSERKKQKNERIQQNDIWG